MSRIIKQNIWTISTCAIVEEMYRTESAGHGVLRRDRRKRKTGERKVGPHKNPPDVKYQYFAANEQLCISTPRVPNRQNIGAEFARMQNMTPPELPRNAGSAFEELSHFKLCTVERLFSEPALP